MTIELLRTAKHSAVFAAGEELSGFAPSPEPHATLGELIMLCAIANVTDATGVFVWPDGFTQILYAEDAADDLAVGLSYKQATVTEPHEYIVSHTGDGAGSSPGLLLMAIAWGGLDASVYDDVSFVANSADAPPVDVVHRNCHIGLFFFIDGNIQLPLPDLAGYTLAADLQHSTTDLRLRIWLSDEAKQPPSDDPPSWTGGTADVFAAISFVPQGSGGDAWVDLEVI